ncbi:MAG: hypothetical protein V8T62_07565 [Oscillospiraceae bacterium]
MNDFLLKKIQDVVVPAGRTEPVAIALNAATARDHLKGKIKSVRVKMDIPSFEKTQWEWVFPVFRNAA